MTAIYGPSNSNSIPNLTERSASQQNRLFGTFRSGASADASTSPGVTVNLSTGISAPSQDVYTANGKATAFVTLNYFSFGN